MDYEKMLYYADTNKMSHGTNGNLTPTAPTINFKVGATVGAQHHNNYLQLSTLSTIIPTTATSQQIPTPTPTSSSSSPSTPTSISISSAASATIATPSSLSLSLSLTDPYAAYADNFDLSLLPQDCVSAINNSNENIPTTVYQYTNDLLPTPSSSSANTPTTTPPQIKIEQTWNVATNNVNANVNGAIVNATDIKQELNFPVYYDQLNCSPQHQQQQLSSPHTLSQPKSPHQLIPPLAAPAYRQPYPSPQSSPAQSEYGFPSSQFAGCYDSLSSSRSSLYPSSPCPSIDTSNIKQELHILPPSPPESNCEASPPHSTCGEIKSEPIDAEVETLIDLNSLFEKTFKNLIPMRNSLPPQQQQQQVQQQQQHQLTHQQQSMVGQTAHTTTTTSPVTQQQNQVLREYLEDTTFQKKHNLKPLALDSFIGDLEGVGHDIEPVISLALEHAKREADETCAKLQISQDPSAWSPVQVHAWLRSTIGQFKLQPIDDLERKFCEDGSALILLSEEEFQRRAPESGSTLHAQLEIWKMAYSDSYQCVGVHDNNNINANSPIAIMNNGLVGTQQQHQQTVTNQHNASEQTNDGIWSMSCMQSCSMDTEEDTEDDEDNIVASTSAAVIAAVAASATTAATTPPPAVGHINGAINVNGTVVGAVIAAPATAMATTTANANASNASATTSTPTTTTAGGETTVKQKNGRSSGSHIHLWQFLKELLAAPHLNGTAIRWIDRTKGVFKIEDSVRVAKLWGRRKNRPAMNYDKLSRSIRQYYKKGIMKKTERSQRLVYQFCAPYHL